MDPTLIIVSRVHTRYIKNYLNLQMEMYCEYYIFKEIANLEVVHATKVRDRLQILHLRLNEFKGINRFLFPLK